MSSVIELYEARVASGEISDDEAQRAVLPLLDAVVARLSAAPAPDTAGTGRGWFARLVGQQAPRNPAPAAPQGLYLWGGVGRGKSMLMDLLMEAAPIRAKRRVHFHAFMQEIQAGLNRARREGLQDAVRPVADAVAAEARLLCFDEMQITDIADAMIVGRLFQILLEHGVVVVTTSNRAPSELYKNGLNRQLFLPFIELLERRLDVYELQSPRDHRQDRLAGRPVWFCPPGPESRAAMDEIWAELTAHEPPAPLRLQLQGRSVEIPAHSGRNGRASFWELCGQPLGPADYLAIADALDVLLIDNIPRLSSSNFNEARRFVTLIDALYEARVRVMASAAAAPESLYIEGEGSFEFERTASRLREMQDAAWGKASG